MDALFACATCIFVWTSSIAQGVPTGIAHHGTWQEDRIVWESRWVTDAPTSRLDLAYPLPESTELMPAEEGLIFDRDDAGQVVAITLSSRSTHGVFQLAVPQMRRDLVRAPLIEATATQRIILDGATFEPAKSLGYEKHMNYRAAPGLGGSSRKHFERDWIRGGGKRARTSDQALYLVDDGRFDKEAGIPGQLGQPNKASILVQGGLVGVSGLLLFLGMLVYRGLNRLASNERTDAYIRSFDAKEKEEPATPG